MRCHTGGSNSSRVTVCPASLLPARQCSRLPGAWSIGKPGFVFSRRGSMKAWLEVPLTVDISTPTITPAEVLAVSRNYGMMVCPLIYPGQVLHINVSAAKTKPELAFIRLRLKAHGEMDALITVDSDPVALNLTALSTLIGQFLPPFKINPYNNWDSPTLSFQLSLVLSAFTQPLMKRHPSHEASVPFV